MEGLGATANGEPEQAIEPGQNDYGEYCCKPYISAIVNGHGQRGAHSGKKDD